MDWFAVAMFLIVPIWGFFGLTLTPWWRDFWRKRREVREEAEAERLGFQDPSTEAIIKILTTDYEGWEMVSEYEIRHTSGIIIKHPYSDHPSLFTWYYPGYGSPNHIRSRNRHGDKLTFDQRKMLGAVRRWKIHKARELFNAIAKEAHE